MSLPLSPFLKTLPTYLQPGRPIEEVARELNLPAKDIIKVASNENPFGPSPLALAAMQKALPTVNLYPDGNAFYLKKKLAEKLGVETGNLILGNGSNEIIIELPVSARLAGAGRGSGGLTILFCDLSHRGQDVGGRGRHRAGQKLTGIDSAGHAQKRVITSASTRIVFGGQSEQSCTGNIGPAGGGHRVCERGAGRRFAGDG